MSDNSSSCPLLRLDPLDSDTSEKSGNLVLCLHCGTEVSNLSGKNQNSDTKDFFCCRGCEFIYKTLGGLGLSAYYKFLNSTDSKARQAVGAEEKNFSHFDSEQLQQQLLQKISETHYRSNFYLPGIHCAACIWLLEKLPTILNGVYSASVNFTEAKIEVEYDPAIIKLSQIAQTLNSLGYSPTPLIDQLKLEQDKKQNRNMLFRIGVAGFCATNTMMLSVSIFESFYSGIEAQFGSYLRWGSALLALPAVTYAAIPFYRTALAAILTGALHIDLPIAAAIIIAYLAGIHSCIYNNQYVYFDSVTTLIFLLLVGRYLQSRAISKARASSLSSWDLLPTTVRILKNTEEIIKPLQELKIGDNLKILAGERIPVDGIIIEGQSSLDSSFLTGESIPLSVSTGAEVQGGAINIESDLIIKAYKQAADSRIGKILNQIDRQQNTRSQAEDNANQLSAYFVSVVFILSIFAFILWQYIDPNRSFEIVIALLIVTCPCALGLAIPAAVSITQARAKKRGIFIRRSDAFEAISQAQSFYFDKTGTLTTGSLAVEDCFHNSKEDLGFAISLANFGIIHPTSKAIYNFCNTQILNSERSKLSEFKHLPGQGVEARDESLKIWRLGSLNWIMTLGLKADPLQELKITDWQKLGYSVNVLSDGSQICALFALSDSLNQEAKKIISLLNNNSKNIYIISGDSCAAVKRVAKQLNIDQQNAYGELLPQEKLAVINKNNNLDKCCVIGDGLNDAQSMKTSFVSIGLRGGIEATIEVASIFISSGKLSDLKDLLVASFKTKKVIQLNLIYACIYNIIGAILALSGQINPLIAAFVMPISSLTIITHSLMNKTFKDN